MPLQMGVCVGKSSTQRKERVHQRSICIKDPAFSSKHVMSSIWLQEFCFLSIQNLAPLQFPFVEEYWNNDTIAHYLDLYFPSVHHQEKTT